MGRPTVSGHGGGADPEEPCRLSAGRVVREGESEQTRVVWTRNKPYSYLQVLTMSGVLEKLWNKYTWAFENGGTGWCHLMGTFVCLFTPF